MTVSNTEAGLFMLLVIGIYGLIEPRFGFLVSGIFALTYWVYVIFFGGPRL